VGLRSRLIAARRVRKVSEPAGWLHLVFSADAPRAAVVYTSESESHVFMRLFSLFRLATVSVG